jgi:tetratricopeptide (TPR) repeat protein
MASPLIANLERMLGTPRDGALLRYSLGCEYLKLGEHTNAVDHLRAALERDARYSAAWRALGKALAESGRFDEAIDAYRSGIDVVRAKGDKQAEKEMAVFLRRLERGRTG